MSNILIYIGAIIAVFLVAKLLTFPIKIIWKLLINALLGGLCLLVVNWVGGFFSFHIDINFVTSLIVGVLGVPGIAILAILKMF